MKHVFIIQTVFKIKFSIPKEAPVAKIKGSLAFKVHSLFDARRRSFRHQPHVYIYLNARLIVSDLYIQMSVYPGDQRG